MRHHRSALNVSTHLSSARKRNLASTPLATRRLAFESLESRRALAATPVTIYAAGSTGSEAFQLQIDGVTVASWTNTRVLTAARTFDAFTYTHPTDVTIDRVRVVFTNDGLTAGGQDRNLTVDGVSLGAAKYETEASTVYSTGTWDAATNGRLPGFRQSETLHYNGYLQFGAAGSTVQVRAAGRTGEEQIQLQVAGQTVATFNNVGGNYATGQFVTFTYSSTTAIPISQLRVVYANDGNTAAGVDRNLRVDAVTLDGIRYETEGPNVFSTGTYVTGQGRVLGKLQTEYLHLNGYFQYGATGSVIEVRAAGRTGEEQMQLQIAGTAVATFNNVAGNYSSGQFQSFVYLHPTTVALKDVRVAYTNDGNSAAGVDRNLRVDGVTLDGTFHQAEAANVYSTGTYIAEVGRVPGLWQSEYLHSNGYFQFASTAVPGVLALGTSLITVNEAAGTVSIPVVRTGGSDGTVGLRYTTVNATALAGSDYTAKSGLVVFAPGETTKSIVVPITDDLLDEISETFNLAVDQSIGGATVNQPRTATITIVDNDGPPDPGNGNGWLAAYYNDHDLSELVFERTDAVIDQNWGGGSPSSSIDGDTFSIRWTGKVEPLYSETYTFRSTADDGVRLWVNNQLIIDQWWDQPATEYSGAIALVAGQRYDIRLEYYENGGQASAKLEWSSPSQARQLVPQSQVYSDPPAPTQNGTFSLQTTVAGLAAPTAIDFDASGRMFISEQRGTVRVVQNGQLLATPFLDITSRVNYMQDRGMLGVAVHPNFPATPYIYVSYTYDPAETLSRTGLAGPDGSGNRVARVSRFTADPATGFNTAIAGSEVVLVGTNSTWANISHPELDSTEDMSLAPSGGLNGEMRDILVADSRSHTVGNVAFGPDGKLYVSNGDGASFGRVDPRAARTLSLDSLSGKLLRIDPITGAGLADNPFFNGDAGANRSKVFDYGLRNPFRFAFEPTTGLPYISDVGWNTWEEINVGRGKNFGWPFYEGGSGVSNQTGGYKDLGEAQAYYASGATVSASLWARTHSAGAVAIVAGDFYTGNVYPSSYQNALFLSDFGDNQLRVLRTNAGGGLQSVTAVGLNIGPVVEMSMGRDGYLYLANLASGTVSRLLFTPASASLMAAEAPATTPLSGDLSGDGVVDGADFLAWQRGYDGNATAAATLESWKANFGSTVSNVGETSLSAASVESESVAAAGLNADLYWLAFEADESSPKAAAVVEESAVGVVQSPTYAPFAMPSLKADEESSLIASADEAFDAWEEEEFDFSAPLLSAN
ncbi:carbohydrate-binding domain-containing protein [Lacipirellula parvula]|uniref:PA14 domain-containing protein n=1 Tax=Lacipirellula parvula TaxID=2650471 RepID=A0A5K7XEV5_9BACT|nr:carbohydrate-binding domain-containing protein [Lacipirellula parvula]BBO31529.1 hypothetical protein PLANPX_1141 [Lacipirellula parvula]